MSLQFNDTKISKIYVGNNKINKIFFGNNLIYNTSDTNIHEYFYFEAIENYGEAQVGFYIYRSNEAIPISAFTGWTTPTFEYSYDKNTWYSYTLGSTINIHANKNKRVYFRGDNTASWILYESVQISGTWESGQLRLQAIQPNTKIKSGGNIMSLRYKNFEGKLTIPCMSAFSYLFSKCAYLVTAPSLPATTLTSGCYAHMFENCTSLIVAPSLPATTLAYDCYSFMFTGCISLIAPPSILPATTTVYFCYQGMFNGCRMLKKLPKILATNYNGSTNPFVNMFVNTPITISATATTTNKYTYRVPYTGTASGYTLDRMFDNSVYTPPINTIFYVSIPTAT